MHVLVSDELCSLEICVYESIALSESLVSRRAETFGNGGLVGLVVISIMRCMIEMNGCMDRERVGMI